MPLERCLNRDVIAQFTEKLNEKTSHNYGGYLNISGGLGCTEGVLTYDLSISTQHEDSM